MVSFATTNKLLPSRDGLDVASFQITLKKGQQLPLKITGTAGMANMLSNGITSADAPLEMRLAWVTPSQRKAELQKSLQQQNSIKAKYWSLRLMKALSVKIVHRWHYLMGRTN